MNIKSKMYLIKFNSCLCIYLPSVQMQQDRNPAYTCTSVQEMLSLFLTCCSYATASHVTSADSPCNVSSPFPQIFSEFVGLDGSVSTQKRPGNIGKCQNLCVHLLSNLWYIISSVDVSIQCSSQDQHPFKYLISEYKANLPTHPQTLM